MVSESAGVEVSVVAGVLESVAGVSVVMLEVSVEGVGAAASGGVLVVSGVVEVVSVVEDKVSVEMVSVGALGVVLSVGAVALVSEVVGAGAGDDDCAGEELEPSDSKTLALFTANAIQLKRMSWGAGLLIIIVNPAVLLCVTMKLVFAFSSASSAACCWSTVRFGSASVEMEAFTIG